MNQPSLPEGLSQRFTESHLVGGNGGTHGGHGGDVASHNSTTSNKYNGPIIQRNNIFLRWWHRGRKRVSKKTHAHAVPVSDRTQSEAQASREPIGFIMPDNFPDCVEAEMRRISQAISKQLSKSFNSADDVASVSRGLFDIMNGLARSPAAALKARGRNASFPCCLFSHEKGCIHAVVRDALKHSGTNSVEIILLTDFFFHDCMDLVHGHIHHRKKFLKEFKAKMIYQTFGLPVAQVFSDALRISGQSSLHQSR